MHQVKSDVSFGRAGATKITLLLLAMLVGCQSWPSGLSQRNSSPQSCPITYDERLSPKRLTPGQIEGILAEARVCAPAGRPVWFILVHDNSLQLNGVEFANVSVYFEPDTATPRMRKGKFFRESYASKGLVKQFAPSTQPDFVPDLLDYVQVSLESSPFGKDLEVPASRLWPFPTPDGFTDADVIEIVDFIRTPPDTDTRATINPDGSISFKLLSWYWGEPIFFIRKDGEVIEVRTGAMQHSLGGGGSWIRCIKKDGKWVVLESGTWVS